jgi:signal transduction histidine kinase
VTTPDQIQFVGPTLGLDNRVQYTAALAEPGSGVVWMGTLPAERLARLVDVAWPATGRMHAAAALIDTTSGTGTNYDKIDIEGKVELLGDTEGVPVEVVREAAKKLGTRDQWTDTLTDETGVEWHVTAGNVLPGNHSMAWVVASLAEPPERPDADRYLLVSIGVGAVIAALAALGSALLPARALRRLRNALLTGDTEKLASISTGVSEVNAAADAAAAQTAEAQRRSADADRRTERLSALHLRTTESTAKANRQLAAELHDGPLQTVLATGLGLGEGPAAEQLATASVELRRITAALTADEFARGGLVARISDVIADIADQPDGRRFNVTLDAPEQVEVDPEVGHVLVRATTELLRNSYKHSGSASAHVRIAATDDLVRLTVADDGVGFTKDPTASNGFGLFSLQVQVEELGGTLTIHESSSDGAKVSVAIPPHGRRSDSREER